MKVQLQRQEFTKLIGKIQSIVPTKPSLPILANVLIEAENNQIVISATDLTVSMRVFGVAKVEEPGAITLPARRLFQLAREMTTPDMEIELTSPESAVIRSGTSHFRIQGMPKSEFPALPDLSEGFQLRFKAEKLKEMLTRTSFAAAKDDSRQVLNGILMQKASSLATFVGTDGKRLARNQMEVETDSEEAGSYIVPLKAVDEVVKLLEDKEEEVKLITMPEKLAIEAAGSVLITKLLSGQYPEVSRVIPQKTENTVTLHRDELIALLRQVALFTSEGSNSVRFTFSDGELNLSATSGEIGEGKVSMPVNYSGPKLEIAFNPHYFLDILRHSSDETVLFDISDSYNPGRITDSSKAEFVIMPMRLEV
ncbi:MAG: DNA polymerase III subunit beta [Simkaniaceae bacterium]|nr:DNA polymerase III subunit beta [Candidatus Sacchlamyda saccharinae]